MDPADLHSSLIGSQINTSQQSTICEHCRAIFSQPNSIQLLISSKGLEHRRNRYSMVKTALDGCNLCRELLCMPWDSEFQEPGSKQMAPVRQQNAPNNWPLGYWESIIKERESKTRTMTSLKRHFEQNLRFKWLCRNGNGLITLSRHQKSRDNTTLYARMSIESDKPEAKHSLNNRFPKTDTTCDRTYKKIRNWLVTCDNHHSRCRNLQSGVADAMLSPSLILDLSVDEQVGFDQIRMRRMAGRKISYAALSYCWGEEQPYATSKSNVATYLTHEINVEFLPQTIQDAIVVTRKLGLQYLWVDSMCIVQDSDDEKAHEIGRMSQIYSNAYVTISASHSAKCTDGFLKMKKPNVVEIPVCTDDGTTVLATVEIRNLRLSKIDIDPEPIYSRAWTFQESFMSRRMLICSKYQIFWCCAHDWGKDGGSMSRDEYFSRAMKSDQRRAVEVSRFSNETATIDQWQKIIEIYSMKELSDPMDKLPALSCLASFFAERMNARYLAGVWSNAIPTLLCWYPGTVTKLRRPYAWRSPSWSFLSVDGGVLFREIMQSTISIEVTSSRSTPVSTQAPFGQISSASLVIQGPLIPIKSVGRFMSLGIENFQELEFDAYEFETPIDRKYYTVKTNCGDITHNDPLWALPLGASCRYIKTPIEPGDVVFPWGIILACLPNGHYHRVGHFRMYDDCWDSVAKRRSETFIIV